MCACKSTTDHDPDALRGPDTQQFAHEGAVRRLNLAIDLQNRRNNAGRVECEVTKEGVATLAKLVPGLD